MGLADGGFFFFFFVAPRQRRTPPKGGWSAFHNYAIAADILNPIAANFTVATATRRVRAGPNDPEMEKEEAARRPFEGNRPGQGQGTGGHRGWQNRALETAQYGWLGQWGKDRAPRRSNVGAGCEGARLTVLWNITQGLTHAPVAGRPLEETIF